MSLQRKKISDLPSDAIILTEKEAIEYQTKILNNWKHQSDTVGYRWGPYVLGWASFVSGYVINSYYRKIFKLMHYGRASTYLPTTLLPCSFSTLVHMEFVMRDVVLQKRDSCPVCVEMRASALQAMIGCVFPLLLAPLANLSMAHKYATYNIPDIVSQPKQVFSLVKLKSGPFANIAFAIFLGQALLGSAITYWEANSVITVNDKLAKLEHELENN